MIVRFGGFLEKPVGLKCWRKVRPIYSIGVYEVQNRSISAPTSPCNQGTSDGGCNSKVKISIVGAGQVGLACINSIMQRELVTDLTFVDVEEKRIRSEQLDIHQSGAFLRPPVEVTASKDYNVTTNSRIVVVSAGARQSPGENRTSLQGRNVEIFKKIIPEIVCSSPNAILIIATNPVDEMTYVAYKLSGFPINRVIGSGTNLDSGRFRIWIADKLKLRQEAVTGWIIGEHGDYSIPVWSSVRINGKPIAEVCPNYRDFAEEIRVKVVRSAYEIINGKGYTSWGIGSSVGDLCNTILKKTGFTHCAVSIVKGHHDVTTETFASLPCKLGPQGFECFDPITLCDDEKKGFHQAIQKIQKGQDSIQF